MVHDFEISFKDSVVLWVKASRCEVLQSSIVFYAPVAYPVLNELAVCQINLRAVDRVRDCASDYVLSFDKGRVYEVCC